MKASVHRRITKFERFAYSNFVPVNDVLKLMDEILTVCQTKPQEPWSAEFIELVESFAEPLRVGDVATFRQRAQEKTYHVAP